MARRRKRGMLGGRRARRATVAPAPPARPERPAHRQPDAAKRLAIQADDPDKVRAALDAAASSSSALWITFITFGTYLVITVGSVTHLQLFLEDPIKLPLLNVDLPLLAFFWLAPILFVIFHAYLLFNLLQLGNRVRRYDSLVDQASLPTEQADRVRLQLPGFVFVQFVAVPRSKQASLVNRLPGVIAWVTVVVAPILLLLFTQIQFLPYHSHPVTWLHRGTLLVDFALLAVLWPKIVGARLPSAQRLTSSWTTRAALIAITLVFSVFVAVFPGEPQARNPLTRAMLPLPFSFVYSAPSYRKYNLDADLDAGELFPGDFSMSAIPETEELQQALLEGLEDAQWADVQARCIGINATSEADRYGKKATDICEVLFRETRRWAWVSPYNGLFAGSVNEVTGGPTSIWSNTLVLTDQDFVDDETLGKIEKLVAEEGKAPWQGPRTLSARGRNLESAYLVRADLRRADFTGANLNGAALDQARLQGALFGCAVTRSRDERAPSEPAPSEGGERSEPPSSGCASLREASLSSAELQGASFDSAQLQGASFISAQLQGATLRQAQLQGGTFFGAQLAGADLESASLLGASFYSADLLGTSLNKADLRGASLSDARLIAASLEHTKLQGASFYNASLPGASFVRANMQGSLVAHANVWRADVWGDGDPLVLDLSFYPIADAAGTRALSETIPVAKLRDAARERLDVLVKSSDDAYEESRTNAWKELAAKADERRAAAEADFAAQFHDAILTYACDGGDDVVAAVQGRMKNLYMFYFGFDDISGVPRTARDLLECPIARALDRKTLARLRVLADLKVSQVIK